MFLIVSFRRPQLPSKGSYKKLDWSSTAVVRKLFTVVPCLAPLPALARSRAVAPRMGGERDMGKGAVAGCGSPARVGDRARARARGRGLGQGQD